MKLLFGVKSSSNSGSAKTQNFTYIEKLVLSGIIFSTKGTVMKKKCPLKKSTHLTTGMPDCPASSQSGTGLKKINDAERGPVPE
jgi:hypothetical protein